MVLCQHFVEAGKDNRLLEVSVVAVYGKIKLPEKNKELIEPEGCESNSIVDTDRIHWGQCK